MKTANLPAPERVSSHQNAANAAPPIDTQVLFSHCMGNVSFAFTLLNELEAIGKQQVDAIVLHAVSNEPYAVADAAHSLKGAAAIIGAERLREKAAEIEAASSAGKISLLLDMAHDLRREMDRCLTYIPIFRTTILRR